MQPSPKQGWAKNRRRGDTKMSPFLVVETRAKTCVKHICAWFRCGLDMHRLDSFGELVGIWVV